MHLLKRLARIFWSPNPGPTIALLMALVIALIIALIAPIATSILGQTTADYIANLRGQGYWVLAAGDCYPEDFVPCTDNTQRLGSPEARWKEIWLGSSSLHIGEATISTAADTIDLDRPLTLSPIGKVWKEVQPDLDYATVRAKGKPTQVYRGTHSGFSLPIYDNDNEELYVNLDILGEWDGITNPVVHIHCFVPGGNGWYSPTGHVASVWDSEVYAYDEQLPSDSFYTVSGNSWSPPITFTIPASNYSEIRTYAEYNASNINEIDLDAYYNANWYDVYQGAYPKDEWFTKSLVGTYSVTSWRMKFYNDSSGAYTAKVYETDITGPSTGGNFKLEIGYCAFTPGSNDIVSDIPLIATTEVITSTGNYLSYLVEIPITCTDMTNCAELGMRLRRVAASENEIAGEVVITHIGVKFLRDKLGEVME